MREKISELPEEEAERVFRLPNSYYERGLEQGLERGMDQGLERIVQHMVNKNLSNTEIAELTGLSESEVETYKSK